MKQNVELCNIFKTPSQDGVPLCRERLGTWTTFIGQCTECCGTCCSSLLIQEEEEEEASPSLPLTEVSNCLSEV